LIGAGLNLWATFQTAIVTKLRLELPEGTHVNTAADVASVTDAAQITPGVIVIYGGAAFTDEPAPGSTKAQIQMEFIVVSHARIARGSGATDAAAEAASELCDEVIGALLGWDIALTAENKKGSGQVLRLSQPLPPVYDGGYCMAPLAFSVRRTVKSKYVT
jgi:hypothetical protein